MSFFESITKKSKLKAAIKQTIEARNSQGSMADQMFTKVYHDYAEVVSNELLIAEALYNWGFALLLQAKTKSSEQAIKLYEEAITKFSFCLTLEPAYLGAAIDGGVAYMELARLKAAAPSDSLYENAQRYFEQANGIQAGSASYNLACIYGLRGEKEACLTALEIAKGKGSLPVTEDILNDPDLKNVKNQVWFMAFIEALDEKPDTVGGNLLAKQKPEEMANNNLEAVMEQEEQADVKTTATEKNDAEACLAVEDFKYERVV